jgi:hypothetical protein
LLIALKYEQTPTRVGSLARGAYRVSSRAGLSRFSTDGAAVAVEVSKTIEMADMKLVNTTILNDFGNKLKVLVEVCRSV